MAAIIDVGSDRRVASARIVVGACSEVPRRIESVEARIVGQVVAPSLASSIEPGDLDVLSPIDDVRGTATYRRDVATTLVRRAVAEICE